MAPLLERVAFGAALVMALSAPHSIAATQAAWLIGMVAWMIRLALKPRVSVSLSSVGIGLIALFGWTAISSAFSYEPAISLDKLRGVAVFLIFIYVLNVIRNRRAAILLVFVLIASTMASVIATPIQKLVGRGVEVEGVVRDGALSRLGVLDGDTLLRIDGKKIGGPEDIVKALEVQPFVEITLYRPDYELRLSLKRTDLAPAESAEAALGFASWKRSSKFRSAGFLGGHYATFAEILQLVGAMVFGLMIAGMAAGRRWPPILVLAACLGGIAFALLLTVTRASQLGFLIACMVIVLIGSGRKVIIACIIAAIPLALLGLYVLQSQRQVGFFDARDGSIQYRQMMWRDGARLMSEKPAHLIVGVGMDSIKKRWEEWGLYDKGWQPMGHFHSTPVQLAVERGIPALIIWFLALALYGRTLWRGLKNSGGDWKSRGILLGCAGSLVGFFASGLVHNNLGDQEVAMMFYIVMAIGVKLSELPPVEDLLLADAPILRSIA